MQEKVVPVSLSDYPFSIDQLRLLRDNLRKQEDSCKCKSYPGDNYWCSQHGHGRD